MARCSTMQSHSFISRHSPTTLPPTATPMQTADPPAHDGRMRSRAAPQRHGGGSGSAAAAAPPAAHAAAAAPAAPAHATAPAPTTQSVGASLRTLRHSLASLHQLAATSRGPHGGSAQRRGAQLRHCLVAAVTFVVALVRSSILLVRPLISLLRSVKLLHLNPLSSSISFAQSSGALCSSLSIAREHVGAQVLLQSAARASESVADGGLTALHLATGSEAQTHLRANQMRDNFNA